MRGFFIREYYQFINKMLPILETKINQDKVAHIKKILLDMEIKYTLFKRKLMQEIRDIS